MPAGWRIVGLVTFLSGIAMFVYAMSVHPFVSSVVRIQDDRGQYLLPEKALPTVDEEGEDGIIVTSKQKRNYGAPHFWLMIGRGALSRCSSISYDNNARQMLLNCSTAET